LIITEIHNEGHCGRDKSVEILLRHYFWPHARRDMERFVQRCYICQVPREQLPMQACICHYLYLMDHGEI
jgi:hypothetical protein